MSSLPIFATTLAATASRALTLKPAMTDSELFEFCRLNEDLRMERMKTGIIEMNAPIGSLASNANGEVLYQLSDWWKTHRLGRVYDSSAGFHLPDGSLLSPDASYLSAETFSGLTREQRRGFPHVCPEFVIELLSETGSLAKARRKMDLWIANGVQLGWLVNPAKRHVVIYTAGAKVPATISGVWVEGSSPIEGFRLHLTEVWDCY